MKGVQCYELFGGIALKINTFSFHIRESAIFQSQLPLKISRTMNWMWIAMSLSVSSAAPSGAAALPGFICFSAR